MLAGTKVDDVQPVVSRWATYRPSEPSGALPVDLVVRAAEITDCDAIAAIEASRDGSDPGAARDKCIAQVPDPQRVLLAAVVKGMVIGFARAGRMAPPAGAQAGDMPDGWFLLGVMVADAWRRRGIGRAMTLPRLRWIGERADAAYYFTNAGNKTSIALHRELGFVEIDPDFRAPGVSSAGGPVILFRLDLKERA
jgi:ribosomal protein S18 acetylase RimI-like enzyme